MIKLEEALLIKPSIDVSTRAVNTLINKLEKLDYDERFSNRHKAFSYVLERFLETTDYEFKKNSQNYKGIFHSCYINAVLVNEYLLPQFLDWAITHKDEMNGYLVWYIKDVKRRKKLWRKHLS